LINLKNIGSTFGFGGGNFPHLATRLVCVRPTLPEQSLWKCWLNSTKNNCRRKIRPFCRGWEQLQKTHGHKRHKRNFILVWNGLRFSFALLHSILSPRRSCTRQVKSIRLFDNNQTFVTLLSPWGRYAQGRIKWTRGPEQRRDREARLNA